MSKPAIAATLSTVAGLLVLGAIALRSGDLGDSPVERSRPEPLLGRAPDAPSLPSGEGHSSGPATPESPNRDREPDPHREALPEPLGEVSISGTVVVAWGDLQGGEPIANAEARLLLDVPETAPVEIARVLSDEKGAFALRAEIADTGRPRAVFLLVAKEGWVDREGPGQRFDFASFPFRRRDLFHRLSRPFVVTGRVLRAEGGEPIAGARVRLYSEASPAPSGQPATMTVDSPEPSATTDYGGRFRIDLGREARASLLLEAEGCMPGLFEVSRLMTPPDVDVFLRGSRGSTSIRGVVVGPDGAPVRSVRVGFQWGDTNVPDRPTAGPASDASLHYAFRRALADGWKEARTASDGSFSAALPIAGNWTVSADRGGLEGAVEVTLKPAETAFVRLQLDRTGLLRGRVVDEYGTPIAAMVYLRTSGSLRGMSAFKGDVEIEVPRSEEPYLLYAELGGRRTPEIRLPLLAAGEIHDFGTLALPPK